MTKSLIHLLRIDPNSGVLDFPGTPGMGTFEVGWQDHLPLIQDLASLRIDGWVTPEPHVLHNQIAEMRSGRGEAEFGQIAAEFHEPLCRQDTEPLADSELPRPRWFSKASPNCVEV